VYISIAAVTAICGSELARDGGLSGTACVTVQPSSSERRPDQAPTRFVVFKHSTDWH